MQIFEKEKSPSWIRSDPYIVLRIGESVAEVTIVTNCQLKSQLSQMACQLNGSVRER
eukprot:COSAG01_NODE_2639_length_7326_cov_15.912550_2_plen_57_part_00